MVSDRIGEILENIEKDSDICGTGEKVKVIAVTKFRSIEDMKKIASLGLTTFGENRIQEFNSKYENFGDEIKWHIIGSLQKNKLRYIIGKVEMIQSVDSLELAGAVDDMSSKRGVKSDILLEFNISGEQTKHGLTEQNADEVISAISGLKNIRLKGIMMMAPNVDDENYLQELFAHTRSFYESLLSYNGISDNIDIDTISMGMSHDYRLAVRNGSNMVRLGTILFS